MKSRHIDDSDDASEAFAFDPDRDAVPPLRGFSPRVRKESSKTSLAISLSRTPQPQQRLTFANVDESDDILRIEVPATPDREDDTNEDDLLEIPETQIESGDDADADASRESFHIVEPNTEPQLNIVDDDSSSSAAVKSLPLPTISQQSSTSATTPIPSAPYRESPRRRSRASLAPGSLCQQLETSCNRSKSSVAFWQHERRAGLVESGQVVRVLELMRPPANFGGGGCWLRVEQQFGGGCSASTVLVIDGELKMTGRLSVGQLVEVDVRMAGQPLEVTVAERNVRVYPNVLFIREHHQRV